jgi:osmotically-inducible protein OsmY
MRALRLTIKRLSKSLVVSWAIGAAVEYFMDPVRGKARRAQAVDRAMGLLRRTGRRVERLGRRLGAEAYGIKQRAAHLRQEDKDLDDATLANKVRSELFNDPAVSKGQINVNVEEGMVVLRGTADPAQAEALAKAAMALPGVRGVENLLHLPGTPAPNKAPSREASMGAARPIG